LYISKYFGIYEWERKEQFLWAKIAMPFDDWKFNDLYKTRALTYFANDLKGYKQMSDYLEDKTAYVLKKYKK
jgi:hypothetical protein